MCRPTIKFTPVFIGEKSSEQRFSAMHEKTVMPCANMWTTHLHPIPPSSGLIMRGKRIATAYEHLSVFSTDLNN